MRFETRLNAWGQLYLPKKLCKNLGTELQIYPQRNSVLVVGKDADLGEVLNQIAIIKMEIQYEKGAASTAPNAPINPIGSVQPRTNSERDRIVATR